MMLCRSVTITEGGKSVHDVQDETKTSDDIATSYQTLSGCYVPY